MEQKTRRYQDAAGYTLPPETCSGAIVCSFSKNKLAVIGLLILVMIVSLSILAPLFTGYDPVLGMDLQNALLPPGSAGHLLGTDDYGRDLGARLLYGGRTSVLTGLSVALLAAGVGVLIGSISGYYGGWLDAVLMRLTDIMLSFPFLVIAIAMMAVLGATRANIILILALVSWPGFARLTRSQVLAVKELEFVQSAKATGYRDPRIIVHHILPNCMGPLIVQLTLMVGTAILSAASLNFLGLGTDGTQPDWGIMLNQGRYYLQSAPYLTMIPGLAISLTVLAMNWVGDGLRDVFDPRLRR